MPVAGALGWKCRRGAEDHPARPAKPFEGVTLQFAKAPFGTDEKDVIAKLLKPFEDKTGAKIEHTIVPWNVEGATYATNYAGPNPFDVSYQTSTDLTGLGTKGVLEVLNTSKWLNSPAYATTESKFIPNTITKSTYQGKLYGLPCIIGGTVIYYNKDLLAKAGVANIPRTETELAAAAAKVQTLGGGVWGHNVPLVEQGLHLVLPLPRHPQPRRRHHLEGPVEVTFNIAQAAAALQFYVDLIMKRKVQPPVGQYDREAGVSLFKAGRIAFLHDEPLRITSFRQDEAPVQVGLRQPGGLGGKRTIFSTTGHWVMASKGKNKDAAWELRQVPLLARVRERVRRALRLGAGAERRQHEQGRRAGQACQRVRPEGLGRSPDRPEDGSAHRRLRPGDRGRRDRQDVGQGRAGQGAEGRHRDPQELTGRDDERERRGGCRRKRQRQPGTS